MDGDQALIESAPLASFRKPSLKRIADCLACDGCLLNYAGVTLTRPTLRGPSAQHRSARDEQSKYYGGAPRNNRAVVSLHVATSPSVNMPRRRAGGAHGGCGECAQHTRWSAG